MKKYFVYLMALIMLISTFMGSFAQANLLRSEPKNVDEVICALVGAVAAGVVVDNLVGKDPATFIAAPIGGAIGNDYCKNYVNNAEYQAIKNLMIGGLGPKNGPRTVRKENAQFLAAFTIHNHGSRSSNNEFGTDSQCVQFDASIYKKENANSANDRFMGNTGRYWACQNGSGEYEIVRGNSGIYIDNSAITSTSVGGGSGSGANGSGISSRVAAGWASLDFKQIAVGIKVLDIRENVRRSLYVTDRNLQVGFYAGGPEGHPGVKIAIDTADKNPERNYGAIVSELDLAIECDVMPIPHLLRAPYCQSFEVKNLNFNGIVLNGRAQYIFKNGDMVVIDQVNGRFVVPRHLLVR